MTLTGVVLCGGRSTRMGQDKGALRFGSETMLERVTRIVGEVAERVVTVGRLDQHGITVHDSVEDLGPLSGIAAGLAASTTDLNVIVACDMPLVKPAVLRRLIDAIGDAEVCVAVVDGHPSVLCGVYRSRVVSAAQALLDTGERRVTRLLARVTTTRVDGALLRDIDPHLDSFLSVDTPEKYARALACVRAEG
ncbi:MAG TPA: molybdenum cofactor guanylyltransferase [Vicinamibacterales bacterium]|nr:molybdenum cofactor guanylyltransferase [Vicinamibacterales bacterium]